MTEIHCPTCGGPLVDRVQRRGVLINRIATAGARVIELRERVKRMKGGLPCAELQAELALAENALEHLILLHDENAATPETDA